MYPWRPFSCVASSSASDRVAATTKARQMMIRVVIEASSLWVVLCSFQHRFAGLRVRGSCEAALFAAGTRRNIPSGSCHCFGKSSFRPHLLISKFLKPTFIARESGRTRKSFRSGATKSGSANTEWRSNPNSCHSARSYLRVGPALFLAQRRHSGRELAQPVEETVMVEWHLNFRKSLCG